MCFISRQSTLAREVGGGNRWRTRQGKGSFCSSQLPKQTVVPTGRASPAHKMALSVLITEGYTLQHCPPHVQERTGKPAMLHSEQLAIPPGDHQLWASPIPPNGDQDPQSLRWHRGRRRCPAPTTTGNIFQS